MTTTEPDLTEHLLSDGPNLNLEDQSTYETFRIDSDELATWALRKLAQAHGEKARIRAQARVEIDRIQAWAMDAEAGPTRDAEFFLSKLNDYHRQLEANNPGLPKSYKLPTGTLKRAKSPDKVSVVDEAAFLAWAEEHAPDAVQRKPLVSAVKGTGFRFSYDLNQGPLGDVVDTASGEFVPGVVAVHGDTRYEAKPASDLDGPYF